jgi:hypothetical protein
MANPFDILRQIQPQRQQTMAASLSTISTPIIAPFTAGSEFIYRLNAETIAIGLQNYQVSLSSTFRINKQ